MTTFDQNHWQRMQDLFERALFLDEAQRAQFVREATGDHDSLCREVQDLLLAYKESEPQFERPHLVDSATHAFSSPLQTITPEEVDGYIIERELYRGGQGVVYLAEQLSTKRLVALKHLHAGPFLDERAKKRFEREVELAGSLHHPGIVKIFDSGLMDQMYYYVMEYIPGERLDDYVSDNTISTKDILNLFVLICDAVNYAHQHGVIHRDLKPSNILIDEDGNPHIVDFGLAKLGDPNEPGTVNLSLTGQVLGTLAYMSPEQASGNSQRVDIRSDVYSLGVILYELLTNHLPYPIINSMVVDLQTIQMVQPATMRSDARHIDSDLVTIVLTALNKAPERRYQTAGALGQDIRRHLAGLTIEAKRDSLFYTLSKAVQRHRVATVSFLTVCVFGAISYVVSWSMYLEAEEARQLEAVASDRYRKERDEVQRLRNESQSQRYLVEMNLASRLHNESGGMAQVNEILKDWAPVVRQREELLGWEWYYLNSDDSELAQVTLRAPARVARFSPDGRTIAVGDYTGKVHLYHARDFSQHRVIRCHNIEISSLSWSPDNRFLAAASVIGRVKIFDLKERVQVCAFSHGAQVGALVWHPQDPMIASSGRNRLLKLYHTQSGQLLHQFEVGAPSLALDWSPSGNQLAFGTLAGKASVWNYPQRLITEELSHVDSLVSTIRWNHRGTSLATVESFGDLKIHEVQTNSLIWSHKNDSYREVFDLAWSPDDSSLATVGEDRSIKIWDPLTNSLRRTLQGHSNSIRSVDWDPEGNRLLTASLDRTVRLWNFQDEDIDRVFTQFIPHKISGVDWSPDDSEIAVACRDQIVIVSTKSGKTRRVLQHGSFISFLEWNHAGDQLVVCGRDQKATIWDIDAGTKVREFDHQASLKHEGAVNVVQCARWSPDGSMLATSTQNATLCVWDIADGELIASHQDRAGITYSLDWDPTQSQIAASNSIHGIVWSFRDDKVRQLDTDGYQSKCCRWNPEGTRLALTRDDGLVAIYDSLTWEEVISLMNHTGRVTHVEWHPDGRRLVTASADGTVRIWDAQTGTQTFEFNDFDAPIRRAFWSHDGTSLAVGTHGGLLHIFDATTGYQRESRLANERQLVKTDSRVD